MRSGFDHVTTRPTSERTNHFVTAGSVYNFHAFSPLAWVKRAIHFVTAGTVYKLLVFSPEAVGVGDHISPRLAFSNRMYQFV